MSAKKILFLMNSLNIGGAEKQTIQVINHLDPILFKIFVCYIKDEDRLMSELNRDQLAGLYCLDKKMKFDFGVLGKLKEFIQKQKPEIIVCVDLYPSLYAHILRIFYGMKFRLVTIVHCTIMPDLYNKLITTIIYAQLLKRSDAVAFVCKNQMIYWIDKYGIDKNICQYIYNGVNTEYFQDLFSPEEKMRLRESWGIAQSDTVICICAAMRKEKRHQDLIDACIQLNKRDLKIKLLFVGDGIERGAIEAYCKQKNMMDKVMITGFQRDVRPLLAISDVVVLCSTAETFSVAILEAMSMGKAIIASDIGGASEQIIQGQNGFLFPAGNVMVLAEKLELMLQKGLVKKMGEASRAMVCEQFSEKAMIRGYQEYFASS